MSESDGIVNGCFRYLYTRTVRRKKQQSTCSCQRNVSRPGKLPREEQDPTPLGSKEEKHEVKYFSPCCDFSYGSPDTWWNEGETLPSYALETDSDIPHSKSAVTVIESTIDSLNGRLRDLSLKIHAHPELRFQERYAHDLLTDFTAQHGFKITKHYLGVETAWRAEYSQGKGERVIGINSEMDALPGIGHACGHNLIAISGVGVALALKAALQAHPHVSGKVILLGTPAEESGGGKVILLDRGGYDEMDVCIMCHPGPGPRHHAATGTTSAMQRLNVEYFGQSAHAGAAPWEGTNALDAAFLAYSGISVLRQQIKPDYRVHGVVEGKNWQANVIPDYAKMTWLARAPTYPELSKFVERVQNCLLAAALATGCKVEVELESAYFDMHQDPVLAQGFADVVGNRYGLVTTSAGSTASTDFGNVSYVLPSLHPMYAIPTGPNSGNHTPGFAKAAKTEAAHAATLVVTKGLALTGYRLLTDDVFFNEVRASFEEWKSSLQV